MTQTITNARRRLSIEEEEAARGFISSIFNFSVFHHKKRMERGAFLVVWQWRTDEDGNCDEIQNFPRKSFSSLKSDLRRLFTSGGTS